MFHPGSANRTIATSFLILVLAFAVSAQQSPTASNRSTNANSPAGHTASPSALHQIVATGHLEILRWPDFSDYRLPLETLYQRSAYAPLWIRAGSPAPQALEMISILQQADFKGLAADDYDGAKWPERLAALHTQHTPSDEAAFDVALTVCTMRYVSDLRTGRVHVRNSEVEGNMSPKQPDLPALIGNLVATGADLKSSLANLEPTFAAYSGLQTALAKYLLLAKQDDGEKLPVPHTTLIFGSHYDGAPRLAKLLALLGDLPQSTQISPNSQVFDLSLSQAVKHFQKRHALTADGYLTPDTVAQLNIPLSDRVEQMRLALERYRWFSYDFPQPPIIVNIPAFRLYAMNEDGKVALSMPVDVGQEFTPTPMLEDKIEYLVFRPYWDVPADIQKDEIVGNIKENPDYLSTAHFEAVAANGDVITDGKVSSEVLREISSGKLHIRQKPGPDNSLGLVKFIFPNRYSVYLHDTPAWGNFFADFGDHDVSHGCIHLKEPAKLAAWVLRDNPEWTLDRIQQAMQTGKNDLKVNLSKPLPVLIVYATSSVRENGDVYFYRDVYGYDAELRDALAKGYPYPRSAEGPK
jgi:murein L,D-transpeptidase YcbB/YkuD